MKILMCPPDHYGIEYEINPWMKIENKSDHERALSQWNKLYQTIHACGADISLISPINGCPDMTFTANAGLLYKNNIILSHFKYPERETEAPHFEKWFKQAGFQVLNPVSEHGNAPFFEGAGDALTDGEFVFVGFGFRSDLNFYTQTTFFDQDKLVMCELVDPYFYHIDTCFCPLDKNLAIWYPNAFSEKSQALMQSKTHLIAVNEEEAKRFACNAVVINKHVITPTGCPNLANDLKALGYTVFACEMDEYLKAGGACKCLTMRLD